MRPTWNVIAFAALVAAPISMARAELPECAGIMAFGVDCRVGTAEAGGIALSGFAQLFGGSGTRSAGGQIAFHWAATSASTSTLRMVFDPTAAEALRVAVSPSPSSFGGTLSGTETLSWTLSAFAGGSILAATLGQGTPIAMSTCATSLTGVSSCGVANASVSQSVNGSTVGLTETEVNASTVAIQRTSSVSVARGAYLPWYTYTKRCGSFGSTCTRTERGYFGGGIAETPDSWIYEFRLAGIGVPAADPGDLDPGTSVPEPASGVLLLTGVLALLARPRRSVSR